MTRINLVPPEELCNQHLLAEYRELTRIPTGVLTGRLRPAYPDITEFVLGPGHVKFFADKQAFLLKRYGALCQEMRHRHFQCNPLPFIDWTDKLAELGCWNDYAPTLHAIALSRERIAVRMPEKPRFTSGVRK